MSSFPRCEEVHYSASVNGLTLLRIEDRRSFVDPLIVTTKQLVYVSCTFWNEAPVHNQHIDDDQHPDNQSPLPERKPTSRK